ncbi:AAA family ATPase [Parasphingorhabdus sp.]|uniref:AAA family ATPase n=1 Tax=Parasphingorhabdus sp. TaxID=2709688 RepID=UPI002F92E364
MSRSKKQRGLVFKGIARSRELTASIRTWGARGATRVQARELAEAQNAEFNSPQLVEDEFEHVFKKAWAIVKADSKVETFCDLSKVESREAEFLINPYIPRGALTILDGHPGQGKSLITNHLAAAITTGGRFADKYKMSKGNVLFMSPEDDPDRVLRPRLEAQGADIDRIRFMARPEYLDEYGRLKLRNEIIEHPVELVAIDPIPAFVSPETNTYRATEVRGFMQPLAMLARELDIAILIVRHLRKGGSDTAIEAGQGSMDFIAAVRSGLMIFRHPVDDQTRVFSHPKSNWAKNGPSLTFELESKSDASVPTISWLAEIEESADQLLKGASKEKVVEVCAEKIGELLVRGPIRARDALDQLIKMGFAKRTIDRAKDLAEVKAGRGPGATWTIRRSKDRQ